MSKNEGRKNVEVSMTIEYEHMIDSNLVIWSLVILSSLGQLQPQPN